MKKLKDIQLKILAKEMEIDILGEIDKKGYSLDTNSESSKQMLDDFIENYRSERIVKYEDDNKVELGWNCEFKDKTVYVDVWEW